LLIYLLGFRHFGIPVHTHILQFILDSPLLRIHALRCTTAMDGGSVENAGAIFDEVLPWTSAAPAHPCTRGIQSFHGHKKRPLVCHLRPFRDTT